MVAFANVKERVSLTDAMARLGLTLTEQNGAFRGPCPACNAGGKRALVITPEKGAFCWHAKKGGDQIWLASHIRNVPVKDAAEWLAGVPEARPTEPGGMKPLDHLHPKHERVQAIISEETATALGVGFASKGVMRSCVAVPVHDGKGVLLGYVGIEEDGAYRFPPNLPSTIVIFNSHQVQGDEVRLLSTVEDVLRAFDQGLTDAVCFLTPTVSHDQFRILAAWLEETKRATVF